MSSVIFIKNLMKITFNRISGILGIVLGTTYLISSYLKSVSAAVFAEQLRAYGVWFPEYLSSLIIVAEALLGIVLILGAWQRQVGAISALVLIVFTLGYTYGLYFFDITDCGCFGNVQFLNSSPLWLYLRNAILLAMSVFIFFHPVSNSTIYKNAVLTLVAMIIGGCVVAHLSGLSSRKLHKAGIYGHQQPIAVAQSPLRGLFITHPDSTYLVFAFSYSCPHCLNSLANLNEYESSRVVDKVIGITREMADDETFHQWFKPDFQIINIESEDRMIAKELPTSYYIRNDSVVQTFQGEIPCAFLFSKIVENM